MSPQITNILMLARYELIRIGIDNPAAMAVVEKIEAELGIVNEDE